MAAVLHFLDQRRLIDSNGIADGASVRFCLTGTTTTTPVYTTDALDTPLAQPIVVGSGAALPDIYLDDSVTYRRIITYPDGSTDDMDPYQTFPGLATTAALAAPTGTSLSGYMPSGTGAVADTAKGQLDKLARFYPENFGAVGNGTVASGGANDAAAINACDLAAAAVGGIVVFRNSYRTTSQLLMSANWHFEAGRIIRDWTTTTEDKDANATIKGRGNDTILSFYVDPGPYVPVGVLDDLALTGRGYIGMSNSARAFYDTNASNRATTLYMLCDNFFLDPGVKLELGGNDWCVTYGGDDAKVTPNIVPHPLTTGPHIFEDGFHILFGNNGAILPGTDIESGDDSISFANGQNIGISHWTATAPILWSAHAYAVKIASQRIGGTAAYGAITEAFEHIHVKDFIWKKKDGVKSRNGFVTIECSGGAAQNGIVRNCTVTGGDCLAAQNNGLPTGAASGQAAVILSGPVQDCFIQLKGSHPSQQMAYFGLRSGGTLGPIRSGMEITCPNAPNWTNATVHAAQVSGITVDCWLDGDIKGGNAGGGTKRGALTIAPSGEATTGFYSNNLTLRDTPASSFAITLNAATNGYTVKGSLTAFAESGAASTRVISPVAVPININGYRGDVGSITTLGSFGTPTEINVMSKPGASLAATISAGAFNFPGPGVIKVLCEGGVSDGLIRINNARKGQTVIIKNGEAAPGTAVITVTDVGSGSGRIQVGGSRTLDSADSAVCCVYDGATWKELWFV